MVQDTPSRHLAQFQLRLPDGMREKLKDAAQKGNRTLNAEIVSRLEFSFQADLVVQNTGWDLGHGHDTPEFKAAYLRSKAAAGGVGADAPCPPVRQFSDEDLDYLAGRLAARFQLTRDK